MRAIRFYNPHKSDIALFDGEGFCDLVKMSIISADCTVIYTRSEVLHLTPQILYRMVKYFHYLQFSRFFVYYFYLVYLLACIDWIAPKVVLTYIDNNGFFHQASRRYKNAVFLAIQNGVRSEVDMVDYIPQPPHPNSRISMPNYICFGYFERDLYSRHGHTIDRFYPVGALRGSYFQYLTAIAVPPQDSSILYDICLVSQWHMDTGYLPQYDTAVMRLDAFLKKYVEERGLTMCIATRAPDGLEHAYFKATYGDKATIIANSRETMTTYQAIEESALIFTIDSTVGKEAFGWGKKVLFVNLLEDTKYSSPREGIWSINQSSYESFREKADFLRTMDPIEYTNETAEYRKYLMNYDPEVPVHIFIKRLISDLLANTVDGTDVPDNRNSVE